MIRFQHRRYRTTTAVLSALAHGAQLITGIDALTCAKNFIDGPVTLLASLSVFVGLAGITLMTMCLAFNKIPDQLKQQTQEQFFRLKSRHFTFKAVCCATIAQLDIYLASKMRPHHFGFSLAATLSSMLTVLALAASARDLYLTQLELKRRQRKHVRQRPINRSKLPDIGKVKRQDSWVP